MPASRATLAVAIVPLLFACSHTPEPTPRPGIAATAPACGGDGVRANTCVRAGGQTVCHAFVGIGPGGNMFVFPQDLQSGRGTGGDRKRVIVWHLVTPRVIFEPQDGPLELKGESEFEQWGPTDDFNGAIENKPRARHYRIGFKNSAVKPDGFKYTMRLRAEDGREFACDPKITNDAD